MFPISGVGIEDGVSFEYCRAVKCQSSRNWDYLLVIEAPRLSRYICRVL